MIRGGGVGFKVLVCPSANIFTIIPPTMHAPPKTYPTAITKSALVPR